MIAQHCNDYYQFGYEKGLGIPDLFIANVGFNNQKQTVSDLVNTVLES